MEGFEYLTLHLKYCSLLQLGIRKVFEPRQADFSPMTTQRGIYVTNIEQAITVNIRNYVDPSAIPDHSKY